MWWKFSNLYTENFKQESNANDILASNGASPNHGKGNKVELRNSRNTEGITNSATVNNMEYANAAWMHEVGSRPHESALTNHDPIITDTNLAEIDFEDFRNEDLAYAFSCGVSLFFSLKRILKNDCIQLFGY